MSVEGNFVDGNAAAGPLAALFAVDITTMPATCAGCGTTEVLATARVYGGETGLVARCRVCTSVLLRLVHGPDRSWVDLRGLACLEIPPDE
jgi:hypothetical protein